MAEEEKPPVDDKPTEDEKPDPDAGAKKALDAERKARRDAEAKAKDLENRLKGIEDKDKSEVERLTEQVTSLTKERDQAIGRSDRLEVALTKSLDEDQARRITTAAKRLTGANREELEADADEFLSAFAAPTGEQKPAPPGGKPREDLRPGGGDPDQLGEPDYRQLAEKTFTG
jgi:hypothetical protein